MIHSRFGNTGYWIENINTLSVSQGLEACRAKGGHLVMFKESGGLEHLHEFMIKQGMGLIITL